MTQLNKLKMKKINTNSQRCSYNLKLKGYTFLVCIFFIISLSSCSENPITPIPPLDILDTVDLYDWEEYWIPIEFVSKIYAADSNNIWITGTYEYVFFDGKSFSSFDMDYSNFRPIYVSGLNKSDVFFLGASYESSINYCACLIRFKNGIYMRFDFCDSNIRNSFTDIEIINENEFWLGTENSFVYQHQDGKFIKHVLPDAEMLYNIKVKRINDVIYAFGINNRDFSIASYKFEESQFNLIDEELINLQSGISDEFAKTKNDIFLVGLHNTKAYFFSGENWITNISFNGIISGQQALFNKLGGFSKDSLVAFRTSVGTPSRIYFYDDNKWKIERLDLFLLDSHPVDRSTDLEVIENHIYFSYKDFTGINKLIKGKLK